MDFLRGGPIFREKQREPEPGKTWKNFVFEGYWVPVFFCVFKSKKIDYEVKNKSTQLSMLRSKGTRMDIRTYEHTLGSPGVPRGPVPVPGFFIQKSVLPSKNQFIYPGKIFSKKMIFYKKM